MRDLTQHLTTRADDSHAAPLQVSRRKAPFLERSPAVQTQVRFFALRRIEPHAPRLCGPPSIPLSFSLAAVPPGGALNALASARQGSIPATPSAHRLQLGLPGYLIPFAPLAFASQRQYRSREPPSPPVFLPISTHFTATLGIPLSSPGLELRSFPCSSSVEPRAFTEDTRSRLHALYAQ